MKHHPLINDYTGEVLYFSREIDLIKYAADYISRHGGCVLGLGKRGVYRITQPWNYTGDILEIPRTL